MVPCFFLFWYVCVWVCVGGLRFSSKPLQSTSIVHVCHGCCVPFAKHVSSAQFQRLVVASMFCLEAQIWRFAWCLPLVGVFVLMMTPLDQLNGIGIGLKYVWITMQLELLCLSITHIQSFHSSSWGWDAVPPGLQPRMFAVCSLKFMWCSFFTRAASANLPWWHPWLCGRAVGFRSNQDICCQQCMGFGRIRSRTPFRMLPNWWMRWMDRPFLSVMKYSEATPQMVKWSGSEWCSANPALRCSCKLRRATLCGMKLRSRLPRGGQKVMHVTYWEKWISMSHQCGPMAVLPPQPTRWGTRMWANVSISPWNAASSKLWGKWRKWRNRNRIWTGTSRIALHASFAGRTKGRYV